MQGNGIALTTEIAWDEKRTLRAQKTDTEPPCFWLKLLISSGLRPFHWDQLDMCSTAVVQAMVIYPEMSGLHLRPLISCSRTFAYGPCGNLLVGIDLRLAGLLVASHQLMELGLRCLYKNNTLQQISKIITHDQVHDAKYFLSALVISWRI
jgi:hypothetical protein